LNIFNAKRLTHNAEYNCVPVLRLFSCTSSKQGRGLPRLTVMAGSALSVLSALSISACNIGHLGLSLYCFAHWRKFAILEKGVRFINLKDSDETSMKIFSW
jgi:hypothetical protein